MGDVVPCPGISILPKPPASERTNHRQGFFANHDFVRSLASPAPRVQWSPKSRWKKEAGGLTYRGPRLGDPAPGNLAIIFLFPVSSFAEARRTFFAFPFCDPQLDGFSAALTTILACKTPCYFVIHLKCEIALLFVAVAADHTTRCVARLRDVVRHRVIFTESAHEIIAQQR